MEQVDLFDHKQPRAKKEPMPAPKKLTPWKPKLSERDITKQIRDWMELKGWVFIRRTPGRLVPWEVLRTCIDQVRLAALRDTAAVVVTINSIMVTLQHAITVGGEDGDPDWLAVHPEFPPVWIEFKREGEKPRPNQVLRHRQLEEGYGFIVIVASSLEGFVEEYRSRVGVAVNDKAPQLRRRQRFGSSSA